MNKYSIFAAVVTLSVISYPTFAALDPAVSTAISGGGTDVITALGLMIAVAVSIWAIKKVYGLFGR